MTSPRGARGGRAEEVTCRRRPERGQGAMQRSGEEHPTQGTASAKPEASEQHGLSPVMFQAISEPSGNVLTT